MPKILCPYHSDTNPSMEVYDDGHCYCFVCGATKMMLEAISEKTKPKAEPEYLCDSMRYIQMLPKKQIRGLYLHYTEAGYYIVWPDKNYYKFRTTSGNTRYLSPRGHTPPLFWARQLSSQKRLVIVEGEINALSIAEATYGVSIVSPGSALNFKSRKEDLISIARNYESVLIWSDMDGPGITALWELMPALVVRGIKVSQITSELDANDLLCKHGASAVSKQLFNFITKDA